MLATVRMFESADAARRALDQIQEAKLLGEGALDHLRPEPARVAAEIVAEAIQHEQLPGYFVHVARARARARPERFVGRADFRLRSRC